MLLGPEFPSLIGGLVGLALVVTAARAGFLVPKNSWDFALENEWPAEWLGSLKLDLKEAAGRPMSLMLAWLPYVALALLLVASRVSPEFKASLLSVSLAFTDLWGEGVSASIEPLYLPGPAGALRPARHLAAIALPRPFGRALGSPAAP